MPLACHITRCVSFQWSKCDLSWNTLAIPRSSGWGIQMATDCPIQMISDCPILISSDCPILISSDCPVLMASDCPIQMIPDWGGGLTRGKTLQRRAFARQCTATTNYVTYTRKSCHFRNRQLLNCWKSVRNEGKTCWKNVKNQRKSVGNIQRHV